MNAEETSRNLDVVPTEAAAVSAALKLSLLAREEEEAPTPSRNQRLVGNSKLAGNSNSAERPPHEESAGEVVGRRKSGSLALFRWQIQLNFGIIFCFVTIF